MLATHASRLTEYSYVSPKQGEPVEVYQAFYNHVPSKLTSKGPRMTFRPFSPNWPLHHHHSSFLVDLICKSVFFYYSSEILFKYSGLHMIMKHEKVLTYQSTILPIHIHLIGCYFK